MARRELTSDERIIFDMLLASLPPVLARKRIPDALGGLVSYQTLAKEDSLGTGPPAWRMGAQLKPGIIHERGTVFYKTEDLLWWMIEKWGFKRLPNVAELLGPHRTRPAANA